MAKIDVYIREYIGQFDSLSDADNYLEKNHYLFDEDKQPVFEEVDEEL